MADMRMVSQILHRQLRRIRVPGGDRRLQRYAPEQRPSLSAATSDRRSEQPSSTAMMARSRKPFSVAMSGAFGGALACRRVGQSPARTPIDFARFTRAMPAADSGRQQAVVRRRDDFVRLAEICGALFDTVWAAPFFETVRSFDTRGSLLIALTCARADAP